MQQAALRFGLSAPRDPSSIPRAFGEGDLLADRYRLVRRIGEGAMGSVWQARDEHTGIGVAVKLLRDHTVGAQRDYIAERMAREAKTLAELRHPAIVRILDFGVLPPNDPYIVMDLLEGESLAALLARSEKLVAEYAIQLVLPVAHGLAASHDLGIVHRDLKPDNVFLAIDGRIQPKLIDFGIVKLTQAKSTRKLTGMGLLGTPDYMAPEQALERPDVDHRSDVWSFSAVLYELLSGKLPFYGSTFAEALYARVDGDPEPLTDCGVDRALWQIVRRGLSAKPEDRWQSMRELGSALASWLVSRGVAVDVTGAALEGQWKIEVPRQPKSHGASEVGHAEARSSWRPRATPASSRNKFRWVLAGAVAAAVVIAPRPSDLAVEAQAVSEFVPDADQIVSGISTVARTVGEHLPLPAQADAR